MAIEVNITPEDIDSLVKDSIMKAALGNFIQKTLTEVLNPSSYDNPIKEKIKKYVAEVADEIIREKYSVQIKQAIALAVEEKFTPDMINMTVNKAMERIVKAAEDRY